MTDNGAQKSELLSLTSSIVAAHVSNNSVPSTELPSLIRDVYQTLSTVEAGEGKADEKPTPAVSIKKSVTPDAIVCLECGKTGKVLKRHIKSAHNETPEEYREKWGLPSDYPMVAPNYSKLRSKRAKQIGLGRKRGS
jgi:predicted transcriptional regulator